MLPAEVADRVKSPYPTTQDLAYAEAVRVRLRELLAPPDAPVRPLLDVAAISEAVESAPGPDVRYAGEVVLQLDSWMRNSKVEVEL